MAGMERLLVPRCALQDRLRILVVAASLLRQATPAYPHHDQRVSEYDSY
jgi:hypothetical protein